MGIKSSLPRFESQLLCVAGVELANGTSSVSTAVSVCVKRQYMHLIGITGEEMSVGRGGLQCKQQKAGPHNVPTF